jgi:hypothetical protein
LQFNPQDGSLHSPNWFPQFRKHTCLGKLGTAVALVGIGGVPMLSTD